MAIAEAWFCAQWPIFVLFLRFVFGLLYGWKIQTWPIIRFLTESVTCWFFICWYLIESTIFCNSPAVVLGESLGRYRHTSSFRQIHNIFCWLEILNYCPDGGNGNFHCSSYFLKATSLICEVQLSFAAHQKYILCFFSLWWMIKGIWALLSLLFIFLWNRKPWLYNFMFLIPLECSKLWIWMGIYFRDILLIRISRGANNCPTCIWENHLFRNEISPHFKFLLSNERLYFCEFLK